jgi:putative DNA primase/helicase
VHFENQLENEIVDKIDPTKIVDAAADLTERQAEDWIADFSKKSQEALAKRAAEKKAPLPDERALINTLARKDHTEYDRVRADIAKTLGIRKGTLDEKVEVRRKELEECAVEVPAHWDVVMAAEEVNGAELLDQLRNLFRRYIVLPPCADIALALWVLHAWTHDACEISPILCLQSPTKRCGKTNVLILVLYLTPRSELAANVSTSSIFRYVEAVRPTLLIDEADSFLSQNEEMRGVLNSGHTKAGAGVIRMVEEGGNYVPKRFSTWAPKAIALIKGLPDTLADRSVIVHLMRKPSGVTVERLRKRDCEEFRTLRDQAARWAQDHSDELIDADPEVPKTLHDRAADNWRPLLAIADLAGGYWPQLARQAACQLTGAEHDGAVNVTLLLDIRTAFGCAEVIRSIDLVAKLAADPESPWAEYSRGKPLTQRNLAKLLRDFQITPETVHPHGLSHGKGYKRAWFEELWAAYCPGSLGQDPLVPLPAPYDPCKRASADETGTSSDFQSVQEEGPHGSKHDNLSHGRAGLHACTDEKPGTGEKDVLTTLENGSEPSSGLPSCAHCGLSRPAPNQVSIAGENLWLHRACETGWLHASLEIPKFLDRSVSAQ